MTAEDSSPLLARLLGKAVVVDLAAAYVCLGTLTDHDPFYLELRDADLHDLRDSTATREVYVVESVRFGIRRNRARILLRRAEVVAIAPLADVMES